jgi:excisionase family DNA binding protein
VEQLHPSERLDELPLLATPKEVARVTGISESQVRGLIRTRRIAHLLVGKRVMIPRQEIVRFISDNTVMPCRDETQDHISILSKNANATTSSGLKVAAAGSAARALQIRRAFA